MRNNTLDFNMKKNTLDFSIMKNTIDFNLREILLISQYEKKLY